MNFQHVKDFGNFKVEEMTKVNKGIHKGFRRLFYKKIISISHLLEGN